MYKIHSLLPRSRRKNGDHGKTEVSAMTIEKKKEKQEQMKNILERLETDVQEVFTSDNYIRL